jgi:hypothetical protein
MSAKRSRGRPRADREIRITPMRRSDIDVRRLARALLLLVQAEERRDGTQTVAQKEQTDEGE